MTDQGDYDLKPQEKPAEPVRPKPGEPGWVEPIPVIVKPDVHEVSDSPTSDPDVEKHKGLAILGYILFIIPLIIAPQSKFARFHANQGLLVFIVWLTTLVVGTILVVGGMIAKNYLVKIWFLSMFCGCISQMVPVLMFLGAIALMIIGIINAANGEKKELPLLGHLTLIK
ncbi:MAG: hypothetical protein FWD61_13875 [Phycisphaerales bacterium]|nr:hypothetical protein [Phycisphaerales bacterium]